MADDDKTAKELKIVGELINAIGLHASVLENPRYREMIVAYVRLFEKEAAGNSTAPVHEALRIRIVRVLGQDLRFPMVVELYPGVTIKTLTTDVIRSANFAYLLSPVLKRLSDGKRIELVEDLREWELYAIEDASEPPPDD